MQNVRENSVFLKGIESYNSIIKYVTANLIHSEEKEITETKRTDESLEEKAQSVKSELIQEPSYKKITRNVKIYTLTVTEYDYSNELYNREKEKTIILNESEYTKLEELLDTHQREDNKITSAWVDGFLVGIGIYDTENDEYLTIESLYEKKKIKPREKREIKKNNNATGTKRNPETKKIISSSTYTSTPEAEKILRNAGLL